MEKREKTVRGASAEHWIPAIGRKQEKRPKNIANSPKRGLKAGKKSQNGKNGGCERELAQVGLAVMAGGSAVVVTGMLDDKSGGTE